MSAGRERWLVATTEYAGLTTYTGGIGRHYAALLPALVQLGVDVDLVVLSDGPLETHTDLRGVRLIAERRTDGMPRLAALLARPMTVRRVYRRGDYDRVFLPEWSALGTCLPRAAPLLTNLATSTRLAMEISRLHISDLPWEQRIPVTVQIALEQRQIARSAGLISISTAMFNKTLAVSAYLPPTAVVHNCVEVDRIRSASLTADLPISWPEADGPAILFLGRSERRKGVVDAIDAFDMVHARIPHARLVFAGASGDARFEPTRTTLLSRLTAGARERVTWLGHVSGDELYAAIRAAAVAICPSRWEGFGNVALEVKAIGTPLVVTTGSGFDDFCVDDLDCAMVPPSDPARLADAVRRVLDEPDTAVRWTAAARGRVDAFAPQPVARHLLAAADELLGKSRD